MERVMSVEEKIRRAEEIYERRQQGNVRKTTTVNVNSQSKKDVKLLKKMIIQIIICLIIYLTFYIIQNNNYIFSESFINKAKEILSYDTNFVQIYETIKNNILNLKNNQINGGIGGSNETDNITENEIINQTNENTAEEQTQNQTEEQNNQTASETEIQNQAENVIEKTQEEQEIEEIKNTSTWIKPIEGTITSKFGQREPTTSTVPKNHTGTDIGANIGTKIKSATSGEVVLASEEGDYGKHLKIQIGNVSIIYAHCNALYVKQGDHVEQGQEIAEVGSTGNSTGPHLHFEIRISEKAIDPEKIISL